MENENNQSKAVSDIDTLIKVVMDFERVHKFHPVKGIDINHAQDSYHKILLNAAFSSYELHYAVEQCVPPAPDVDKKLLNCQSYQSYINAGWSDKQLIEAGLLPAAPAAPAAPAPGLVSRDDTRPCLMAQFIIDLKNRNLPVSTARLLQLYLESL